MSALKWPLDDPVCPLDGQANRLIELYSIFKEETQTYDHFRFPCVILVVIPHVVIPVVVVIITLVIVFPL